MRRPLLQPDVSNLHLRLPINLRLRLRPRRPINPRPRLRRPISLRLRLPPAITSVLVK